MTVVILGFTAPVVLTASGNASRVARSAQKRAVAMSLASQQIELFREMARKSTLTAGTVTTSYTALKMGSFSTRRVITVSGMLGTCEVTVTWSDTRGAGVVAESLQYGTIMRKGT